MSGLAERGTSVPRQVSVIGCDDVLATTTYPALSTIRADLEAAARAATALLLHRGEPRTDTVRTVLDSELVLRGTVAAAPPGP